MGGFVTSEICVFRSWHMKYRFHKKKIIKMEGTVNAVIFYLKQTM